MSVSVADLDVAREPAADAQASDSNLLELLIHPIVQVRCEPVQHHDQLPHFCRQACCSSSSRSGLGALGICRRLIWHSVALTDGPAHWPRIESLSCPLRHRTEKSTAKPGGLETVQETHDVMSVNRSLESATDSLMLTFLAPLGASVFDAKDELKYKGFWSILTKSMPSRPNKHSCSRRTRKTLLQNTLRRWSRFVCEILYLRFTVLKVTP